MARYAIPMQSLLTPREFEIASLVAMGKTNRAIASALYVSQRTVENHLYTIFGKLNVHTRTELAVMWYRTDGVAIAV